MLICVVRFVTYVLQLHEDEESIGGKWQLSTAENIEGFFSFLSTLIFFVCSVMVFKLEL